MKAIVHMSRSGENSAARKEGQRRNPGLGTDIALAHFAHHAERAPRKTGGRRRIDDCRASMRVVSRNLPLEGYRRKHRVGEGNVLNPVLVRAGHPLDLG